MDEIRRNNMDEKRRNVMDEKRLFYGKKKIPSVSYHKKKKQNILNKLNIIGMKQTIK